MKRIEAFAAAALTGVLAAATEDSGPCYVDGNKSYGPSAVEWAWKIADKMEEEAKKRDAPGLRRPPPTPIHSSGTP